jgi:hypothetical protein
MKKNIVKVLTDFSPFGAGPKLRSRNLLLRIISGDCSPIFAGEFFVAQRCSGDYLLSG